MCLKNTGMKPVKGRRLQTHYETFLLLTPKIQIFIILYIVYRDTFYMLNGVSPVAYRNIKEIGNCQNSPLSLNPSSCKADSCSVINLLISVIFTP